MNFSVFSGAGRAGTATSPHRSKTLLKHLSLWLILLLGISGSAWAQTYYVFKSGNNYMGHNGNNNITNKTTFDATCIWRFDNGHLIASNSNYLYVSRSGNDRNPTYTLTLVNSSPQSTWTITNDNKFYFTNQQQRYIRYNSGWTTTNSSSSGTAATKVTPNTVEGDASGGVVTLTSPPETTYLYLRESVTLTALATNVMYTPGYQSLTHNRVTLYLLDGSSTWTSVQPTPTPQTIDPTYSWSVTGVDGIARLSGTDNAGQLTCYANPAVENDTARVTVTATYTYNGNTVHTTTATSNVTVYRLYSRTVDSVVTPNPQVTGLTITPTTIYNNGTANLTVNAEGSISYTPAYTHYSRTLPEIGEIDLYHYHYNNGYYANPPATVTLNRDHVVWGLSDGTYAQLGTSTTTTNTLSMLTPPETYQTVTVSAYATYGSGTYTSASVSAPVTLNNRYIVQTDLPAGSISMTPETVSPVIGGSAARLEIAASPITHNNVRYVRCVWSDGTVTYLYRTSYSEEISHHEQTVAPTDTEPFDLVMTPTSAKLTLDNNIRNHVRFSEATAATGIYTTAAFNSANNTFTADLSAYGPALSEVSGTITAEVTYTSNYGSFTMQATDQSTATVTPSISAIYFNNGNPFYLAIGANGALNDVSVFDHNCIWNTGNNNTLFAQYNGTRYYLHLASNGSLTTTTLESAAERWSFNGSDVIASNGNKIVYHTTNSRFELGSSNVAGLYAVATEELAQINQTELMGVVLDSIASVQAGGCEAHPYRNWVALDGNESHAFQATGTVTRRVSIYPAGTRYHFTVDGYTSQFFHSNNVSYASQTAQPTTSSTDRIAIGQNSEGFQLSWLLDGEGADRFQLSAANQQQTTVSRIGDVVAPMQASLSVKVEWTSNGVAQQATSLAVTLIAETEAAALTTSQGAAFVDGAYYRIGNLADDGLYLSVDANGQVILTEGSDNSSLWQVNRSGNSYTLTNYATGQELVWNVNNVATTAHGSLSVASNPTANNTFDIAAYSYDDNSYITLVPAGNGYPYYAVAHVGNNVPALVAAKESTSRRSANSSYHTYMQSGVDMFENARWQLQNPVLPMPAISMNADGYVTFTAPVAGATVRYRVNNGNEQTATGRILLAEGDRLAAYCTASGWSQSAVNEFTAVKVPTPVITLQGGYNFAVTVPAFNGTPSIFYTFSQNLEGNDSLVVDTTNAVRYSAPVTLGDDYPLAVRAYAANCIKSDVATHQFVDNAGTGLYVFYNGNRYYTSNGANAPFALNALWTGATATTNRTYTNQATGSEQTFSVPDGYVRYEVTVAQQPASSVVTYDNAQPSMLLRSPMQQGVTYDMEGNYAYLSNGQALDFEALLTIEATSVMSLAQTLYTFNNRTIYACDGQYADVAFTTTTNETLVNPAGMSATWTLAGNTIASTPAFTLNRSAVTTDGVLGLTIAFNGNSYQLNGNVKALGATAAALPTYVSIRNKATNGYLATGTATVALGNAGQAHFNGLPALTIRATYGDNALWQLIPQGNNAYSLVHVATGMPAVWIHSATDGTKAVYLYNQQSTSQGAMAAIDAANVDAFHFYIVPTAQGEYTIAPYDLNGDKLAINGDLANTVAFWSDEDTYDGNTFAIAQATLTAPTFAMTPAGVVTLSSIIIDNNILAGAQIRYTTVANELTATTGQVYNGAFAITRGQAVQTMLTAGGNASQVVRFEPATTAEPTYTVDGNTLTLTAAEGAAIRYTLDGSLPTYTNGILYTGAITLDVNSNPVVRAVAYKDNEFQSNVMEYVAVQQQLALALDYRLNNNNPELTITPTIAGTSNAPLTGYYTIRYTTDGTVPSATNGNTYTGTLSGSAIFPSNAATLVRAIALPSNGNIYLASEVAQQTVVYDVSGTPSTSGDTIFIASAADLLRIQGSTNNNITTTQSNIIKVTADIDMTGIPFTSINEFRAKWDGQYHTISGLTVPLFNTVKNNAHVYNVRLDNVNINGTGQYVGALANLAQDGVRIYNCGVLATEQSTVSGGTVATGGLVGRLESNSRVVNCYNYADVKGTALAGGVVGSNETASSKSNVGTMVFNCMNYGNLAATTVAPVYGGNHISNATTDGLNTYNFFRFNTKREGTAQNNGVTGCEDRFLERFEVYRYTLNSNVEMCYHYVNGSFSTSRTANTGLIGKWVLDTTIAPYPIIKSWGAYPSIINRDHSNAQQWDGTAEDRYKGRNLGTLRVTVVVDQNNAGSSANFRTVLNLPITDIDTASYDFNYYKVQLPYYNSIAGAPANYGSYAVTGWDITSVVGGTVGDFVASKTDNNGYNFADRNCTEKDLYSVSGRVFAQGGFYNVPEGVTEITITAHWGKAVYLNDQYFDYTYTTTGNAATELTSNSTTTLHGYGDSRPTNYNNQKVYTSIGNAVTELNSSSSKTVYDYVIVLVGNYRLNGHDLTGLSNNPFTIMSVDQDNDNEPDYTLIQYTNNTFRYDPPSIRFDFLSHVGLGTVAHNVAYTNFPIIEPAQPRGHFEITETAMARYTEFEYNDNDKGDQPVILNGGIFEQIVSSQDNSDRNGYFDETPYIILGGNVWFKQFQQGVHGNKSFATVKIPISVTGGEYESFYLSGMFNADAAPSSSNARLFTNGGKFGFYASGGMERINGDVIVKMDNSIVDEFYGGGINDANPIAGHIDVTINNSLVGQYCGGPQFGNMATGKTVTTNATGTTFLNSFYGAGYGGTSLFINRTHDENEPTFGTNWYDEYIKGEANPTLRYKTTSASQVQRTGVSVDYWMEYFEFGADRNAARVDRFYVYVATLSTANTHDVTSTLTDCVVKGNFYGGGNVGTVDGNLTSTLDNTTVMGNVYGAGFSATVPTCKVYDLPTTYPTRDDETGVFTIPEKPEPVVYTWVPGTAYSLNTTNHTISCGNTAIEFDGFGKVTGDVTLNINGNSHVYGSVFGGGDESEVVGPVATNIRDSAVIDNNAFGGGNLATVYGNTTVTVGDDATDHALIRGTLFGGGNAAAIGQLSTNTNTAIVNFNSGMAGKVFAGGNAGSVYGSAAVNMKGGYVGYTLDAENQVVPYVAPMGTPKSYVGVFGGGLGLGTTVTKGSQVNIGASSMIAPIHIYGSVYGGGEEGQLGGGYVTEKVESGSSVSDLFVADADGNMVAASGTADGNTQYFAYLDPASHGNYGTISKVTVVSDGTHNVDIAGAVFGGGRGFVVDRNGMRQPASAAKSIAGVVYADTEVKVGTAGQDSTKVRIGSLEYYTPIEQAMAMGLVPDPNDVSYAHNAYWKPNYFVFDYNKSAYRALTPGEAPQYITATTLAGEAVEDFNLSNSSRDLNVAYFINTGRVAIAGGGEEGAVRGNYNNLYSANGKGGNTSVKVYSGVIGDVVYRTINGAQVGEVGGDVYGGGFGAPIDGVSNVLFDGATAWCRGEVFGGGCMGKTNAYNRANGQTDIVATKVEFKQGWARRIFAGSNMVDHPKGVNSQVVVGADNGNDNNTLVSGSVFGGNGYSLSNANTDVLIKSGKIGHVRSGNDITITGSAIDMDYANFENGVRKPVAVAAGTLVPYYNDALIYAGSVYGSGLGPKAHVLKSHVQVSGGRIRNGVFGGGELAGVLEYADANMSAGQAQNTTTATFECTSMNSNGSLATATTDYVVGNAEARVEIMGGTMSAVFGGGRGYSQYLDVKGNQPGAILANTYVTITGGTVDSTDYPNALGGGNVYGGGLEGVVAGNTYVLINNGTIKGNAFAGGRGFRAAYRGQYCGEEDMSVVQNAQIDAGAILGNTYIKIYDSTSVSGVPVIGTGVYGGGEGWIYASNGRMDTVAIVEGNTKVDISAGTIGGGFKNGGIADKGSYAGGRIAPVRGYADIHVHGNANIASVYGGNDIAGYVAGKGRTATFAQNGSALTSDSTSTYVLVTESPAIGHLFGGGNGAYDYYDDGSLDYLNLSKPDQTSTYVDLNMAKSANIDADNRTGYIGQAFGGANNAQVVDAQIFDYSLGLVDTLFGGGNLATVNNSVNIVVNADITRNGSNTANSDNINYLFGGNNYATMDILPAIHLKKGIVEYVYGGGNQGEMTAGEVVVDKFGNNVDAVSTYILVNSDQLTIRGALYGGSNMAKVHGTSFVDVRATSTEDARPNVANLIGHEGNAYGIARLFGGNDISESCQLARVDMFGGYVHNIFGGGNGDYIYGNDGTIRRKNSDAVIATGVSSRPYCDSANVNLYSGHIMSNVYGGGLAGDCGDTYLRIDDNADNNEDSQSNETSMNAVNAKSAAGNLYIAGDIFGGGCGDVAYVGSCATDHPHVGNVVASEDGSANGTATTDLISVAELGSLNVYGGGNAGDVNSTWLTLHNTWKQPVDSLYGGCRAADVVDSANTFLNRTDLDGYTAKVVFGGNDYAGNVAKSNLTVNGGKYVSLFGAGNGNYDYSSVTFDCKDIVPNTEHAVTNIYSPFDNVTTFESFVYGGGDLGTVFKGDTTVAFANPDDYGRIELNIHGGYFGNQIFTGAHGLAGGKQLVYGLKQLNMDGGIVANSVYGGSQNVNDGYPNECLATNNTTQRPSTIMNIVGGEIGNNVYGGGYFGMIYGSVYVNLGKEAVANSPVWTDTYNNMPAAYAGYKPAFVTNAAADTLSNLMPRNLYVRSSVFSGSDWGEGSGQSIFNTPGFTGGESRIFIDGLSYNTAASASGSDLPFMDIAHSVIGAGTSVEGGDIYTDIIIRNYGHYDCPTVSKELYSIQRADSVLVENSNFKLYGAQDAYTSYPSPGYSFCRIDDLVFRGSNVMHIDVPALYMNSLTFQTAYGNVVDSLSHKQAMFNLSTAEACNAVDMCERLPNEIAASGFTTLYISSGAYINVQSAPAIAIGASYDPTTIDGGTYGPVNGYAFVVAQDQTQAFLTARNKVLNNGLNVDDGGLFSTCSLSNDGDEFANGSEHPYENHSVAAGDYRTWGEGTGSRMRKVTIVAHSDLTQLGNNFALAYNDDDTTANLAYATASLQLPPTSAGHYYVLEDLQVDAANGGQINLIGTAYDGAAWQTAIGVNNPETGIAIARDPNYTFGLVVKTGDNFATSGTGSSNAVLTGSSLFTDNQTFTTLPVVGGSNEIPQLDFVLTYNPSFNLTLVRDVTFKLHEMTADGIHTGNPIEIVVTISTILNEFENTEVDLLAMYNEGERNEFTNKVVLPATLQRRDLYLTNIEWEPIAIADVANADAFHITNVGETPTVTNLFSIAMETSEDINFDLRGVSGWHSESVHWSDIHNLAGQTPGTEQEDVDVNLMTEGGRGLLIGSLDGRNSAALDFTLYFNGNIIYPYEAYVGKVVLTFGWASGSNYNPDDHFTVTVNVRTRVAADTIYMASAESVTRGGVTLYPWKSSEPFVEDLTGKYPSVYLQSFGQVFDKKVFQIGDVIAIIDTINVAGTDSVMNSMFVNGTSYGNVKIIRYPGDHFEFPGEACAYRGPLFNISDNAHFSAINLTIDGQGLSKKMDPYGAQQLNLGASHGNKWHGIYGDGSAFMSQQDPVTTLTSYYYELQPSKPDTLAAFAPIFNVTGSGKLTINEGMTIQNNFNMVEPNGTGTHGGAIALVASSNSPVLEIANNVTIKNNMVNVNKDGAGVYNNGGVIRLQESFDNSVIDIVDNYFAPADLTLPTSTSVTNRPFTYFETPDVEGNRWFVYKMNNDYFDNLRQNGATDNQKNVLSNVYLTRERNTALAANSREDVLADSQSDMIYFDAQITDSSRIGISKWFPGSSIDAPRDTIRFANVSNNNQLFAQYAYNNGNFVSDSVEYGVFWHPTISPFDLYLYRCLTFQKQSMDGDLWVNGSILLNGGQKSVLRYEHQGNRFCPDGNDAILYSVNGGFYPYTFTWVRDNQTIREYTTPYANNLINEDAAKAVISNTDTFATDDLILPIGVNSNTFDYTVTATDLFGCQQVKNIQVNVTKSLSGESSFTANDTVFETFVDLTNREESNTEVLNLNYRAIAVEAVAQPDGFGTIAASVEGTTVDVAQGNGVAYCPGDVIDLVATPAEGKDFVMWDFDPFDNPQASYVVPTQDARVNAYFSAGDYWRQVVTSLPTDGGYVTDYDGNVHIYSEEGLAWLISVVNGLNGQQIRPFFFDSVHIHTKADGSGIYDMSAHKWTPVGTAHHRFRGRVKADDGVVIKGIVLNEPGMPYVGMFGHVDSARFDNINLQGVVAKGALFVGGLAANAVQTEIQNSGLTDNTGNVVSILTTSYVSGGLVGNADKTRTSGNNVNAKFLGTAVYSGGVIGYMNDSEVTNTAAWNIDRMHALYHGGLVGYSTATNAPVQQGAKSSVDAGSSLTNNYVRILSDGTSQRVGGLVGYANNTRMLNNYVYGEAQGTSASGALAATLAQGNTVDHCYYHVDVNNEVVAADPYQSTSNIASFSGNGNQVLMTEYVDGVNNLTRVLNKWVRNNGNGEYLTWRSDLFAENNGFPIFGNPDMIPVYDTVRHASCDVYVWNGEELYESGNYSISWSDTAEMVDTTLTLVLTINEAMTMELFDSVLVGEAYNGYGFSVSATETELLRQTVEQEGFALIELSDTLATVHGCDSIILLSLTVYNSDSTGDVNVITPMAIEISVYPNPTVNMVNVEGDDILSIEVYDNVSRRLRRIEPQSDKCSFSLADQPSGAYYLRIKTATGTVIKKIIKK